MTSNSMYTCKKDSFVNEDEKLSQECYTKFDFFKHSYAFQGEVFQG